MNDIDYDKFREACLLEQRLSRATPSELIAAICENFHKIAIAFGEIHRISKARDFTILPLVAKPAERDKKIRAIIESAFEENKPSIESILAEIRILYANTKAMLNQLIKLRNKPVPDPKQLNNFILYVAHGILRMNSICDYEWLQGTVQDPDSPYGKLQIEHKQVLKLATAFADELDARNDPGLRNIRTDPDCAKYFVDMDGKPL